MDLSKRVEKKKKKDRTLPRAAKRIEELGGQN